MDAVATIGLSLLAGPANSGKMGHVIEWWRERQGSHPLVVAPTAPDARQLSREMVARSGVLFGESPAMTFDGLVRTLLGRAPRYVGAVERSLLVDRLMERMQPRLQGLSPSLPGLESAVGLLLDELCESGGRPEELADVLGRWGRDDPEVSGLAGDVERLLMGYTDLLGDLGLTTRPHALQAAVEAVEGWTRPVAFYGFSSFTPGQRALIIALSRRTEVLLVLSHERGRDVDLVSPADYAAWESMAAAVVEVVPTARAYSSPAIAHLAAHFMSDDLPPEPPPAWNGAAGVRFLLASGQRNEAEMAAVQVARLLQQGFPPSDIAVVVRHPQSWARLLQEVLSSCRIPCRVDHRTALAQTGLGCAFLSGLRGVLQDDPAALLVYLKGPYSGLTLDQASDIELLYRRGVDKGVPALTRVADRVVPGSVAPLLAAVGTGDDGPSIDIQAATRFAREMLVTGLQGCGGDPTEMEADTRAFRALVSALETVDSLGRALSRAHGSPSGGEPAGTPFRWPRLLRLLAEMPVAGDGGRDAEAVQVLSVHRARARRFGAMLVLGLTEGEFPGTSAPPSLLTPAQRARLDALGGGIFSPVSENEAALFASAVSRAWQVLMLSARDADDGGGDATPSYFWTRAKEVLGVAEGDHERRTLADQHLGLETAPAPRHYLRACAATGHTPHPESGLSLALPASYSGWRRPQRLASSLALDELARTVCFSPSALESYAKCPFAWFVERVVGVDELEPTFDGRVVGGLLHQALAQTYQVLSSQGCLPLRAHSTVRAEQVAYAAIENLVSGEDCPGTSAERRLTGARLRSMVRTLFSLEAHAAGGLILAGTEVGVGVPDGIDIGGIRIRGRVDRIDQTVGGDSLFVYDYKSGHIPKNSEFGTEDGLQLALYLLALTAERTGQAVRGGAYLSLKEGTRSGVVEAGFVTALGPGFGGCRVVERDELQASLRRARDVARRAADGMRAGLIAPRTDRECSSWCRLGPACRSRRAGYRP